MRIIFAFILTAALALTLAACGERNAVTGTITFEGDQAIPEGAVMEVQLRDVSLQDAAAPLIASQTIEDPGRFPVDFAVAYEPDDIDSRATYGVQVRVTLNDRLIYINDTAFDVLTRGNPSRDVDMWVISVGG
ncbi:MAG: YbaY family lipoprotein [Chloroflexi bacterium]|nr:YbaY family lipoprotein [Chloroflexota bacterium]